MPILYSKKILQPDLNLKVKNKCVTVTHPTKMKGQLLWLSYNTKVVKYGYNTI